MSKFVPYGDTDINSVDLSEYEEADEFVNNNGSTPKPTDEEDVIVKEAEEDEPAKHLNINLGGNTPRGEKHVTASVFWKILYHSC
jgi:hypothetical protein